MPRPRGEALFRASLSGAQASGRSMEKRAAKIDPMIKQEFRTTVKEGAERAMRNVAPEDTGLLKDIIEGKVAFGAGGKVRVTIYSDVRDPATNFSYTQVTRFGHRKSRIVAKHETSPEAFQPGKKTFPDGDPKSKFFLDKGHAPALAVHRDGRYQPAIYRGAVKGYKPKNDWVEDGVLEVNRIVAEVGDRIGRRIATEVLS